MVALLAGLVLATVVAVAPVPLRAAPTPFTVRGSVEQVAVVGLVPGDPVELLDGGGSVVARGSADAQGAWLFRAVTVGDGYRVRSAGLESDPVTVLARDDHPAADFYEGISIDQGFGYLPTRDGTTLSVSVSFPADGSPGPWPVVVDYSGYDPSQPGNPPAEALVFQLQGYVVVGVNMRGTGCSGGAFDYFEPLQSLDGYDVVEAVARQPWSNGDVGLVGISYPGISQLFVARTQPPHLRAITPLSVIADTYRSTLYPGGILNSGFALSWATDRVDSAKPAARGWVQERIRNGDTVCEANQQLRLQSRDLLAEIRPDRFYEAAGDELSPRTFVDDIRVPVYLSGQFQDEQTGGHFSTMVPRFDPAVLRRVTLTNGTHVEPLGPEQIVHLTEFVDFYVGKRIPRLNPVVRAGISAVYQELFGFPGATIPPDRFTAHADHTSALAAYEAEPPVRVLWENGAGRNPGEPYATAETAHASWPVPGTIERAWYLHPDGRLADQAAGVPDDEPRGVSSYVYDPSTKRPSTYDGSTEAIWKTTPELHWDVLSEGHSLSFVTDPFATETAFAGWGSVDLWVRSEADDTDVEVTITEVRPDGQERFVQSGWLRLSHRRLDAAASTPLLPVHTHLAADAEPLPAGEFVSARVALFPFTHVVRPGSRLRLNVEAPGGNQPFWEYDALEPTGVRNEVGHSVGRASRVVLPQLPAGAAPDVPEVAPPCPSLRNQPCRDYAPARVPTDVVLAPAGAATLEVGWSPPERGGRPDGYVVDVTPVDPPAGSPPSARRLAATSSNEVPGDATSLTVAAEPGVSYIATVQAVYADGPAPVSNASLRAAVPVDEPVEPVPTTDPPSTVPPSSPDQAGATVDTTSGSLPVTGRDVAVLVGLAVALLAAGVGLVRFSRRGTVPRAGGPPAR